MLISFKLHNRTCRSFTLTSKNLSVSISVILLGGYFPSCLENKYFSNHVLQLAGYFPSISKYSSDSNYVYVYMQLILQKFFRIMKRNNCVLSYLICYIFNLDELCLSLRFFIGKWLTINNFIHFGARKICTKL